ncbi:MAG: NAD(P)/FAD-dependent oxidoreductase [Oscillospiraceae bacterium]|jgi:thioredoxin reductase (NADPH)|nr:NAD(P)/FAD-dependent oxidoreductase [Oscillospiraceae bacterium]MCI1990321.1 NAD(P)/FAD-dependent oxidoreductase [Oscillospiraceae bacterium]MCI2034600.1 NAD(P)/FAD-dependent oxidoreductase [Oscillospiraceae bacterium]
MADVVILGRGPAGISTALYTARAGLDTLVIGRGGGSLLKTDKIENYYGFAEPVPGKTLLENGVAQARRVGAEIVEDEVVGIAFDSRFAVSTASGLFRAPFVVLATGSSRRAPKIPGLAEFEGRGVSYCAVCDGFFYRRKNVAVLGAGDYALHEAAELLPLAAKVTVLTDGEEPRAKFPPELAVEKKKIGALFGGEKLAGVRLADGSELETAGLFVALGVAGSTDLARKLGVQTKGPAVVVDEDRRTNVPGFYAAGDCTGGLMQISKAVADGAIAGTSVVKAFRAQSAVRSAP